MPYEFKMPEVAESVSEGEIGKWHVKEGDFVKKDQPLLEVLTDKVNMEVPSPYEGYVIQILHAEGEVIKVGVPIIVMAAQKGATAAPATPAVAGAPPAESNAGQATGATAAPAATPAPSHAGLATGATPGAGAGAAGIAAPAVRALAKQLGVDLATVRGTGPGGRITKEDVESAKKGAAAPAPAAPASAPALAPKSGTAIPSPSVSGEERIPFRGKRRMIAQHLTESYNKAVHTLYVEEVDVTNLVNLRERLAPLAESQGIKLTFLPLLLKALVPALKAYPTVNASLDEERGEIVLKKYYNIGLAVDTEEGLVVPVLKSVDTKTVFEIAQEMAALAEQARKGTLTLDQVQGGTFTVTSAGHIGGFLSMPIISYPEVAILGVHRIRKRPAVVDDKIVIRDMVNLSISFDHRVVDGATIARFMNEYLKYVQVPELLLGENP